MRKIKKYIKEDNIMTSRLERALKSYINHSTFELYNLLACIFEYNGKEFIIEYICTHKTVLYQLRYVYVFDMILACSNYSYVKLLLQHNMKFYSENIKNQLYTPKTETKTINIIKLFLDFDYKEELYLMHKTPITEKLI